MSNQAETYSQLREPPAIERALTNYLTNWHPVEWRSRIAPHHSAEGNLHLGEIFLGLSAIETDSRVIARKIRSARLDRSDSLHEFLIVWQAEESEHGRIFEALARKYGVDAKPTGRTSIGVLNSTFLPLAGTLMPATMRAAYCAQGSLQEFVALQTYLHIAELVEDPPVRMIIRDIARQESRHMKFYLTCANEYLAGSRLIQHLVRKTLEHRWSPPGVDLLGDREFRRIAAPLVNDERYRRRLLDMDAFAGRLPGMGDMGLMARWLSTSS